MLVTNIDGWDVGLGQITIVGSYLRLRHLKSILKRGANKMYTYFVLRLLYF